MNRYDQLHTVDCQVLRGKLKSEEINKEENVYDDLFGDTQKQSQLSFKIQKTTSSVLHVT